MNKEREKKITKLLKQYEGILQDYMANKLSNDEMKQRTDKARGKILSLGLDDEEANFANRFLAKSFASIVGEIEIPQELKGR